MKKLLLSAAAVTLLFASCKKDDDNGGSSNSWTLNGNKYEASTVTKTAATNTLSAVSGTNSATFYFDALPTASGTYVIGGSGANSVDIIAGSLTGGYGNTSVTANATVTVNGGKITITTPEIWMENILGTDSVKFSASITEK